MPSLLRRAAILVCLPLLVIPAALSADGGRTGAIVDTGAIDAWTGQKARVHGARAVDLDGVVHRIGADAGVGPAALVFMNAACPVSNRYVPELDRLAALAEDRGVAFYGVMSDPYLTTKEARAFVAEYGVDFPVLFDPSGDLALRLDPLVTPEAFVVDTGDNVVYRGRIDDRFEAIGVLRNRIENRDLADAIAAAGADDDPAPRRTVPVGCVFEGWRGGRLPETVTYHRDIAPLLAANCVECHRDGSVAPFPLDTYVDAARRANMLAFATQERIMPPWRAAEGFGAFRDERRLSDRQIALLAAWADAGAPPGDGADALPETVWPDPEWRLGEPDLVLEMAEPFAVPADGPDIYRYFVLPFELAGERAIEAVEFQPGDENVVHHANLFVDYSGRARRADAGDDAPGFSVFGTGDFFDYSGEQDAWGIGGWTPGFDPYVLPENVAMWMPAGPGDIVFEIHYHPDGKATEDRSRIGLRFADEPVDHWIDGLLIGTQRLAIPPESDAYWRHVRMEVPVPMTLVDIMPHMHYLGAEAKAVATLPDGTRIPLIHIEDWDFRWQNFYVFREPIRLPAGSAIDGWMRFDNTSGNPYNPTLPPKTVTWGWGTDEEMMEFWINFFLDDQSDRDRAIAASWESWYRDPSWTGPVPDLADLNAR